MILSDAQRAVIAKDLREVLASRQVWLPMLLVPLIMAVVLPVMMVVLAGMATSIPPDMVSTMRAAGLALEGMPPSEAILRLAVDTMFPSLFLLIPVMAASVLAGSSVVGERERHTLESILYAPITARELFVAKVVGCVVPGCAVTLCSVAAFGLVVDAGGFAVAGVLLFPTVKWAVVVLWVGPAVAPLALGVMVLVSARARTFQEAQQFSVLVVLPIVLLVVGQASGAMLLGTPALLLIGAVVLGLDAVLLRVAAGRFTPEQLLKSGQMP